MPSIENNEFGIDLKEAMADIDGISGATRDAWLKESARDNIAIALTYVSSKRLLKHSENLVTYSKNLVKQSKRLTCLTWVLIALMVVNIIFIVKPCFLSP